MKIPDELVKVELKVGDENDNGKVDVSAHVSTLGKVWVNKVVDVDGAIAFKLISIAKSLGEKLSGLLGDK